MNICIVTHSYPRFAGDFRSNFIESLAAAYARAGAQVTVLTAFSPRLSRPLKDDAGVHIIPYKYILFRSWHTIGYGHSMIGDLQMHPVDLLLIPFMLAAGAVRLALLLRKERFDLIHAHWAVPNTLIAMLGRLLAGSTAKVFTSFPGSDVTVIRRLGWLGRLLLKIIAHSNYLSCNGSDLGEDLVRTGLDPGKLDYVIYGVDEKAFQFSAEARRQLRQELHLGHDEIVLLMIGRFVAKKGFSTGLQALRLIAECRRDVKMIVVGDGPLRTDYLRILHRDNTASRVQLVGTVPTHDLYKYYSACDIFVMPSTRLPSDGLNVVVPEAMACARPIVASRVGGNELVVIDGVNGYLHGENDPRQLAERVLSLAASPALREKMGAESRRLVEERFNWSVIAAYYIARYQELV